MRRNDRSAPDVEVRSPARSFAQTLDTYYQPGRDRRGAEALQRGLSSLSGVFEQKAAEMRQQRNEDEYLQGQADALREQAGQELLGVKTGSIFRQHSRYYTMGLNEARGKAAAYKLRDELTLEYENWEGRNSDDPQAFRDWMNAQLGARMEGFKNNPDMLRGAMPVFAEISNNMTTRHVARTNERLQAEQFEAFDQTVAGVLDGFYDGTYEGEDEMVDALINETDELYQMEGGVANEQMIRSVVNYAISRKDPSAIMALARAHDKGKLKLSTASQRALADTMDAIEADLERETSKANARTEEERKARETALLNSWTTTLVDDPYAPLPDFKDVGDYRTYKAMEDMQQTIIDSRTRKDPKVSNSELAAFLIDYNAAETPADKIAAVTANFDRLTKAQVEKYMGEAFSTADPTSAFNNDIVNRYRTNFIKELGLQGVSYYDDSTSSVMTTMGESYFNDYILAKGSNADLKDPAAVKQLVEEAKAYAYEMLVMEYPDIAKEKAQSSQIADRTGLGPAVAADDARIAAEEQARQEAQAAANAAAFDAINNGSVTDQSAPAEAPAEAPEDTSMIDPRAIPQVDLNEVVNVAASAMQGDPGAIEGYLNSTKPIPDGPPLEEQPPPFEDPDSNEPYDRVREGFYGELIKRFTDGQDTRERGHTTMKAREVMTADPEFASEVNRLATKYGVPPNALLAVMQFESGFSPSIRNAAGSGATGLIQFMPSTARALGTTTDALAQMSRAEQMVYVEKYFDQFASRLSGGSIDDIYMAVLWPAAAGKTDEYVLFSRGTRAYEQNIGLDKNKDGTVTKFEAAATVRSIYYDS